MPQLTRTLLGLGTHKLLPSLRRLQALTKNTVYLLQLLLGACFLCHSYASKALREEYRERSCTSVLLLGFFLSLLRVAPPASG